MSLKLIAFNEQHIADTYRWVSNPNMQKDFMIRKAPTWNNHILYFKSKINSDELIYVIITNNTHIGNCGIKKFTDAVNEIWIYIGREDMRRKGYATEAMRLLIYKCIEFNMHNIIVHVSSHNHNAIGLYRKLGFKLSTDIVTKGWTGREYAVIKMEMML